MILLVNTLLFLISDLHFHLCTEDQHQNLLLCLSNPSLFMKFSCGCTYLILHLLHFQCWCFVNADGYCLTHFMVIYHLINCSYIFADVYSYLDIKTSNSIYSRWVNRGKYFNTSLQYIWFCFVRYLLIFTHCVCLDA